MLGFIAHLVEHCSYNVMGSNPNGTRFFSSFPLLLTCKWHEYLCESHFHFKIVYYYTIFIYLITFVSVHLRKASWKVLMLPYPYSTAMGTRHHARLVCLSFSKWPCDNVKKYVAIPQCWLNTV